MSGLAILCSGQGALSNGMLDFAMQSDGGRSAVEAFSDKFDVDLEAAGADAARHATSDLSQPLAVVCALGNWLAIAPLMPPPSVCAGYSVGELSAWACSGIWDVETAAEVSLHRAKAMQRFTPPNCAMIAVRGLGESAVSAIAARHGLHICIFNGDDHFVIGGNSTGLRAAEQAVVHERGWAKWLDVHVPSHTPLLAGAAAEFSSWVAQVKHARPGFRVLQGVDAIPQPSPEAGCTALARAICEPIRWADCMDRLAEEGISVALEMGPGTALAKMMREAHPGIAVRSIADFRTADGAARWVHGEMAGG